MPWGPREPSLGEIVLVCNDLGEVKTCRCDASPYFRCAPTFDALHLLADSLIQKFTLPVHFPLPPPYAFRLTLAPLPFPLPFFPCV